MLVLPTNGLSSASMTIHENHLHRHNPTHHVSPLIPPASLPKHFNVPFAIQHGFFRCVRYLLQLNFDPNERDSQLRTPLILCAYVENDRWSLSLAQNLLEKGAKIALEDHARRNALHHACALQSLHLVQLYLSCLDFKIEAKDCEGNTCLHYVAITGNCEIAELLIRTAEKMGIRLDQYINREGCSAAVLALKYGHIECANQITHRDWDEFFVVPRPLSIYEIPPTATDENQTAMSAGISRKRAKFPSNHSPVMKSDFRPPTLAFGLLKIFFNESDTGYSTRLAGICRHEQQNRVRPPTSKCKKHEAIQTTTVTINRIERTKSTMTNGVHNSSTEALVNESQLSNLTKECPAIVNDHHNAFLHSPERASPRMQLVLQQKMAHRPTATPLPKTQLFIDDLRTTKLNLIKNDTDEVKSKSTTPITYREVSSSTLNPSDRHTPSTMINSSQRAKTAVVRRPPYFNPPPSRLSTENLKTTTPAIPTSVKKKPVLINHTDSSVRQASVRSIASAYSPTNHFSRAKSALAAHRPVPPSNDSLCPIREAKGTGNRFNKPEEVFGLRPEELFAPEHYEPKILDPRSSNRTDDNTRLKRQQFQTKHHIWQEDVDKIIELYNIHHSASYRKSAVPPPPAVPNQPATQAADAPTETSQHSRTRGGSAAKASLASGRAPPAPKHSGASLTNLSQRNTASRSSMKVNNT